MYIFNVILLIFFIKDIVKKYKNPINFLLSDNVKLGKASIIKTSSLFGIELVIIFSLLIRDKHGYCVAIIFQVYYLIRMIKNYGTIYENNCNCFLFSLPREIKLKSIAVNVIISYLFIILIIF